MHVSLKGLRGPLFSLLLAIFKISSPDLEVTAVLLQRFGVSRSLFKVNTF